MDKGKWLWKNTHCSAFPTSASCTSLIIGLGLKSLGQVDDDSEEAAKLQEERRFGADTVLLVRPPRRKKLKSITLAVPFTGIMRWNGASCTRVIGQLGGVSPQDNFGAKFLLNCMALGVSLGVHGSGTRVGRSRRWWVQQKHDKQSFLPHTLLLWMTVSMMDFRRTLKKPVNL